MNLIIHIDNLLLAHTCPLMVTDNVKKLDGKCGLKYLMNVARGKIHEHLGITVCFGAMGHAYAITQCDFIKKLHTSLRNILKGLCLSVLALEKLFKVDQNTYFINKYDSEKYLENIEKTMVKLKVKT